MRRLSWLTILTMVLCAPAVLLAQSPNDKKIAVITAKRAGGPNLQGAVNRFVLKELKTDLDLLAPKLVKRATAKAKVRGKALASPAGAQKIGEQAGATHVLLIEGVREMVPGGKRKRPVFSAAVSIVDVASGDVTFTATYPLQGKKLTKKVADALVVEVIGSLNAPPPEAPEPPAEEPVAETEPPPPPDAPPAPETPVEPESETGELAAAPTEMPAESAPEPAPETVAMAPETTVVPELSATETISIPSRRAARPGLLLDVGYQFLQRDSAVTSTAGTEEKPLTYQGPFSGAYLKLRLFPFSFGGRGRWYEGIGVHLDGSFTQAKTTLDTTNEESTNSVTALAGGVSYRLVFWSSRTAPDFTLDAGYSYFAFPLPSSFGFPGVRYRAAYVGGTFNFPIGESFALLAGGSYMPQVEITRRIAELGNHDGTTAYRGIAGMCLRLGAWRFEVLGRIDGYSSTFTGQPTDANLVSNFDIENAKLSDRMLGATATLGVAF